ncbi:MAG: type II toxin-antitoxin system HipA family toxin [Cellulomonadaceae bacterium]|nr:type II toxin-antitoxin system HipA family toxin [Cellulomonadaceae bacterium]
MSTRSVEVHVERSGAPEHAADLTFETNAGGALISTTFQYQPSWLGAPGAYELSPELRLQSGPTRFTGRPLLPGSLADTGPDRWGRTLLFDAARREARTTGGPLPRLSEADFILLASDATRHGNVRYRDPSTGVFLSAQRAGLPTLVDLEALVHAAQRTTAHQGQTDADLQLLVAGGTTLGGARPKVNVHLSSGRLALAKLPASDDRWDVEAWEATTLTLARLAGIQVPPFELHRIDTDTSVLVVERFDRDEHGHRVGYWSAHTLLEQQDGEALSYVELVDAAGDRMQNPRAQRAELFRRVAFNLLVNDVDDHMKNHGLLRTALAWQLAPAFDLNPWPWEWKVESTPIGVGGTRTDRTIEELIEQAPAFGLRRDEAARTVADVERSTRSWTQVAERFGIADPSESILSSAFDNPNRTAVTRWAPGGR